MRTAVCLALLLSPLAAIAADPPASVATPPAAEAPAVAPKKGYLVFRSVLHDKEGIRPYGRAVLPLVARFGGQFIVTADAPEAVEGSPDLRRIVVIEFPSLAAARAFWTSPEYAEVKKLRASAATVDAILFEGR